MGGGGGYGLSRGLWRYVTSSANASMVSKSIRGEAHLFSKDLYKNKQCEVTTAYFHAGFTPALKGPNASKRERI